MSGHEVSTGSDSDRLSTIASGEMAISKPIAIEVRRESGYEVSTGSDSDRLSTIASGQMAISKAGRYRSRY